MKLGGKLVHPAGTSISKYRRNEVFYIAYGRQGIGRDHPQEICSTRLHAQEISLTGISAFAD
jgi:hypothetical protein